MLATDAQPSTTHINATPNRQKHEHMWSHVPKKKQMLRDLYQRPPRCILSALNPG
jgi:hypothetical protein